MLNKLLDWTVGLTKELLIWLFQFKVWILIPLIRGYLCMSFNTNISFCWRQHVVLQAITINFKPFSNHYSFLSGHQMIKSWLLMIAFLASFWSCAILWHELLLSITHPEIWGFSMLSLNPFLSTCILQWFYVHIDMELIPKYFISEKSTFSDLFVSQKFHWETFRIV